MKLNHSYRCDDQAQLKKQDDDDDDDYSVTWFWAMEMPIQGQSHSEGSETCHHPDWVQS